MACRSQKEGDGLQAYINLHYIHVSSIRSTAENHAAPIRLQDCLRSTFQHQSHQSDWLSVFIGFLAPPLLCSKLSSVVRGTTIFIAITQCSRTNAYNPSPSFWDGHAHLAITLTTGYKIFISGVRTRGMMNTLCHIFRLGLHVLSWGGSTILTYTNYVCHVWWDCGFLVEVIL